MLNAGVSNACRRRGAGPRLRLLPVIDADTFRKRMRQLLALPVHDRFPVSLPMNPPSSDYG